MHFIGITSLPGTLLGSLKKRQLYKNAYFGKFVAVLQLMTFATVALNPHGALAFESNLSNSFTNELVAPVEVVRGDEISFQQSRGVARYLSQSVIADQNPTTHAPEPAVKNVTLAYAPVTTSISSPGTSLNITGTASYYSRAGCLGCNPLMIMANGQPLDDNALTMAIGADKKHLVGHTATVTSLATGKSVQVLITDTGGFYKEKYGNRVADLTIATKNAIGMKGGLGQVRVEVQ